MELRHLRYFVAIAEQGSFMAAAKHLGVAQPALSKQIRDLEQEVGAALFERQARGVKLTPAGEAFLPGARHSLEQASAAVAEARRLGPRTDAPIRLAHGDLAIYTDTAAGLVSAFQRAHPDTQLSVEVHRHEDLRAVLLEERADVVLSFVATWPLPGFVAHRLLDCTVHGVVLPAAHPLAAKPAVALAELNELVYLDFTKWRWPEGNGGIRGAMLARGCALLPAMTRLAEVMPETQIAAGDSWTLATDHMAAYTAGRGNAVVFRPMTDPPIPLWLSLVSLPGAGAKVEPLTAIAREIGLDVAA